MSDHIRHSLRRLRDQGIHVFVDEGRLRFRASGQPMSESQKAFLVAHRDEIIDVLTSAPEDQQILPLTEIQSAYLLGRDEAHLYGSVGCHVYFELEYPELDSRKVCRIWNQLVARHEMLRTVIRSDAMMEILPSAPGQVRVPTHVDTDRHGKVVREIRDRLRGHKYPVDSWPFFTVELTSTPQMWVMHLDFDFMIADWASIWLLLEEFSTLIHGGALPEVKLTFSQYLELESKMKEGTDYDRDRRFWMDRLDTLPGAPKLPVLSIEQDQRCFDRLECQIDAVSWACLQESCRAQQTTPTALLATIYGMVLAKWSQENHFCINLTLLNRMPLHPEVQRVVGDFTSVSLLELDFVGTENLVNQVRRTQRRMMRDLDHRRFSGVEVIREMARRRGRVDALLPFVFTSSIGVVSPGASTSVGAYGRSETPQVFIDCQVMDSDQGLRINWDYRLGILPDRLVDDMFATMSATVQALCDDPDWNHPLKLDLPAWQRAAREAANDTSADIPARTLLADWCEKLPLFAECPAVIVDQTVWTHAELMSAARRYGALLNARGLEPGEIIAVCGSKSPELVAAICGILLAGGAYMPLDPDQPLTRLRGILERSGAHILIADDSVAGMTDWQGETLALDPASGVDPGDDWTLPEVDPTQLAYVIHTSGSTGVPKGVMITHDAAWNTIADVVDRWNMNAESRVLALSRFSFDLSVFDIFGMLSCGGALVLPTPGAWLDPADWAALIRTHRVSVWNSVPAMAELLIRHMENHPKNRLDSLRIVLLSGDWIPVSLPSRLGAHAPNATVVGLGGATEASIWSNYHICLPEDAEKVSIPYGYPLSNQGFAVLGRDGDDAPVWVDGDLIITGRGLACGLLGDPELTAERFPAHDGVRCYWTGDRGRYLPNGEIEFLGRLDDQVKVHGFRIELAEVETAMVSMVEVGSAAAAIRRHGEEVHLLAAVVPAPGVESLHGDTVRDHLAGLLPSYMVPSQVQVVEILPLTANQKVDRDLIASWFVPDETGESVQAIIVDDPLGTRVVEIVSECLSQVGIGEQVSYYDLGADSLVLAQLAGRLRDLLDAESPGHRGSFDVILRGLLDEPTLSATIAMVRVLADNAHTTEAEVAPENDGGIGKMSLLGGTPSDVVRLVPHAGLGTMNAFRLLNAELVGQDLGQVKVFTISDMEAYCALDPAELVVRLGREYAQRVIDAGHTKVQLIGYCMGGFIALEIARSLMEKGIDVVDLTLIDSTPLTHRIEDSIIMEAIFLPNFYITLGQVYPHIDEQAVMDEVMNWFNECGGQLSAADVRARLDAPITEVSRQLAELDALGVEQRFADYTAAISAYTDQQIPAEMLAGYYSIYVHSFLASAISPEPYFGKVTYLQASEGMSFMLADPGEIIDFWRQVFVAGMEIEQIPGNHITCVEMADNAKVCAARLGRLLVEALEGEQR
ncbi:amino acid adenylation domain-containing protein [Propionibacterium sp. oral taxon 192 str. F0372]|uniref:non-ribosomal peptide synthetase n=1 Tax=Propionibacterium sp. oral taxon 192 TaxID=671222 RepID=UPI0003543533|nr:amino acid adenylation domain-containing protein [Propionibacterium sp. oral taxon 192]EPH02562.1 amino acid adenylation domain-containing protein [Propionibacterium sp. oral taxon 192 str. F0372]